MSDTDALPCPRGVEGCDGLACCWKCPDCGCQNCHEIFCYLCGAEGPDDVIHEEILAACPDIERWLAEDERENTCGDPDCLGGQAHAPDQTRPLPAWTPAERDAVLHRTYGRH